MFATFLTQHQRLPAFRILRPAGESHKAQERLGSQRRAASYSYFEHAQNACGLIRILTGNDKESDWELPLTILISVLEGWMKSLAESERALKPSMQSTRLRLKVKYHLK